MMTDKILKNLTIIFLMTTIINITPPKMVVDNNKESVFNTNQTTIQIPEQPPPVVIIAVVEEENKPPPVVSKKLFAKVNPNSLECMAQTIYHEANNQPKKGKIAVGLVIMNRQKSDDYPKSVCSIVRQVLTDKKTKKKVPMFSWIKGKKLKIDDKDGYEEAREISLEVLNNNYADFTHGATHFHANYVRPPWARTMTRTIVIGKHLFYKQRPSTNS